MPQYPIHFFSEDIEFTLKQKMAVRSWIVNTISSENYKLSEINLIFCSDDYLLKINQEYLNHDTLTDIVTFDNSEKEGYITGDIFISIERIRENSAKFHVSEKDELHRVIIHGTLHLLGYTDKNKKDKLIMTSKEDEYLSQRTFI